MNLIWRFLWVCLSSRFSSIVTLLDESTISLRVLPTDVDLLMHMNNGRYFSLMDLGRLDFMIRNQLLSLMKKKGFYPVVASEMIRFKKSIHLFQRFELTTRIVGWDDKFIFISHHFKSNGEVYALGIIKGCFLHKSGSRVSTSELIELLEYKGEHLQMPDWVREWQHADKEFHDETMKENEWL